MLNYFKRRFATCKENKRDEFEQEWIEISEEEYEKLTGKTVEESDWVSMSSCAYDEGCNVVLSIMGIIFYGLIIWGCLIFIVNL